MTHPSDTTQPHDKKGGPVTHHDPSQQRSRSANTQQDDVDLILTNLHHRVTSVEPIARDLNRHLIDLLGPCPVVVGTDERAGAWVTIVDDGEGQSLIQLPPLPVAEALRLSTALAALARDINFSEVRRALPASVHYRLPLVFSYPIDDGLRVSGHVSVSTQ